MSETITLSVIVPAYNESARIAQGLEQILHFLRQQEWSSEIIVVNDGSTDNTPLLVKRLICDQTGPVRLTLLSHQKNAGKGCSVRTGALHARGSVIVFTDADLSAPITELPKLLEPIWQGACDISIGSRAIDRRLIGHRQSRLREWAGRTFNLLMRSIVGLRLKDTQCGFKAFRRDRIVPIFQRQQLPGFGFDVEILYLAKQQGLQTAEIPVVWNHAEGSRVRLFRDSLNMFVDLLRIRWYGFAGKYAHEPGNLGGEEKREFFWERPSTLVP